MKRPAPVILTLLALVALVAPASADDVRTFDWHGTLGSAVRLRVTNINGSITVDRSPGREALVHAIITSSGGDPSAVKIHVALRGNALYVCPVYPGQTVGADCSNLGSNDHSDVRVDFEVHVPAGTLVHANSVNGAISARGLDAAVEANTVNGSVTIATRGVAQAQTVNGSVQASFGARSWGGDLRFATTNGSIHLTLPRSAAFMLQASTLTGNISIDGFPVTAAKRGFVGSDARGTVGSGGGGLQLHAINGSIALAAR